MTHATTHRRPRFKVALIVLAAVLALMLLPAVACAQFASGVPCGERARVIDILHKRFGERLVGSGLSDNGTVFEIYAGFSGGWTIIATDATGKSCLIATGEAWEAESTPRIDS